MNTPLYSGTTAATILGFGFGYACFKVGNFVGVVKGRVQKTREINNGVRDNVPR